MILGDNIFYGAGLGEFVQHAANGGGGATVFCHWMNNPGRYGILEFDIGGLPVHIQEKPKQPKSNWAVTGLYFYDPSIVEWRTRNHRRYRAYLQAGRLSAQKLGRGFAWFDANTHHSLLQASGFIYTIEERQGLKIGCPEEVAYRMGFIDAATVERLVEPIADSDYGSYLRRVLNSQA